jgi:hypothetical protein
VDICGARKPRLGGATHQLVIYIRQRAIGLVSMDGDGSVHLGQSIPAAGVEAVDTCPVRAVNVDGTAQVENCRRISPDASFVPGINAVSGIFRDGYVARRPYVNGTCPFIMSKETGATANSITGAGYGDRAARALGDDNVACASGIDPAKQPICAFQVMKAKSPPGMRRRV